MRFLLTAKAWQVFVFLTLIPGMTFSCLLFGTAYFSFDQQLFLFSLYTVSFMALLLIWLWSLGAHLQLKVAVAHRVNSCWFKTLIIYAAVYTVFFQYLTSQIQYGIDMTDYVAIVTPLHFFAVYSMFYAIYFVARQIVSIEKNEKAGFSAFIGEFFLLWFFPIGIWFVQPRINRLMSPLEQEQEQEQEQ